MTELTAVRSKRRKDAPAHVVKTFPDRYALAWFYSLCGRYLFNPETLPWENTAPKDRCHRCADRLDKKEK